MQTVIHLRSSVSKRTSLPVAAVYSSLMLALSLTLALPAAAEPFESPPVLRARDLVPANVPLKGACYRVDDEAPTDGFLASYTLRSDFGTVVARGPGVLRMRIGEVDALAQLETMEAGDVFADALERSATSLGHSVVHVVTNPVEVAKGIPAGVGRFFGRAVRGTKTAAQKFGDVLDKKEAGAPSGATPSTNETNVAVAGGVAAGRAARDILGYEEQRRHLAKVLSVDPYTTNPLLKKKLEEIAWAAFAGGLGVDVVASQVPGGRLVQSVSTLNEWIYDKPPGDLQVWIETSLEEMGVDQETIDLFLRQRHWTLTTQTMLVRALEQLEGVRGRPTVLDVAVSLEDEEQVRFLTLGMLLLAREHKSTPFMVLLDGKPMGLTHQNRVVAAVAVDYVSWTERMAGFTHRKNLVARRPTLLVTGRLSPRTRAEMQKAGWRTHERVSIPEGT